MPGADIQILRARLAPELVEWFACEINKGDAPQLHLAELRPGDLERCFAAIVELGPEWNDRTFHVDDEGVDVTVHERPEVAGLVARGRASHACIGAENLVVDGIELPLVELFLFPDEIEFFWWPERHWTPDRVAAFFTLVARLLALAPAALVRPDTRYPAARREELGALIGRVLGDPSRVDDADVTS